MKNWKELINNNMVKLVEAGEKAFIDACTDNHLYFKVFLYEDGEVDTAYYSDSNSTTTATLNDEAIEVICHKISEDEIFDNVEISEEWTKEEQLEWYANEYKTSQTEYEIEKTLSMLD